VLLSRWGGGVCIVAILPGVRAIIRSVGIALAGPWCACMVACLMPDA
jgi:hypothetical protein